jgi:DNA-binding response OmpR family regulator
MRDDKHVILYVDDDEDYRFAIRQILEAAGYEMVEASDGEEGLRVLREQSPDLVIVDLMMEEVDAGVALLSKIREVSNTLPVYLLSSVGDTLTMTTSAAELGFNGVFQKPIETERLMAVIQAKLGS